MPVLLRVALAFVALLCPDPMLAGPGAAFAHASLVASDPADGAVVAAAPARFALTFDEPVAPLVLTLIDDAGTPTTLDRYHLGGATLLVDALAGMAAGTHALSWRVVSVDGHPVGGTLVFAVGAPSVMSVETAMAEVTLTPGRPGPVAVSISVLDGGFGMLVPAEVTLSRPEAGIEPIRRAAKLAADGTWRVEGLTLPVAGRWDVDVALLVSDFKLLHLRDHIDLR